MCQKGPSLLTQKGEIMLYNNLTVNEKGHLAIGGLDAVELAAEYGTPLYVLDEDVIRANCRTYVDAMHEYFGPESAPLFASKALCFKGIYPVVQSEGMCFDVVSPGEIFTAVAAGFPASKMFFHGTNKTDADIEYGVTQGIGYFVVDNLNELEVLNKVASEQGIVQKVLLRLTCGLDPHTLEAINTGKVDSQFGVPIDTGQADEFVRTALSCEYIEVAGFHSHVGSQIFESDPFNRQVEILTEYAAKMKYAYGLTVRILNIGGGFGVSIHNTVEAAVWGKPVIFGPENQKFQEAQELKACGGGLEIKGYDDFARIMDHLSADTDALLKAGRAAGDYVMGKAGATNKILAAANL
jgi:diaminopimelate decarboxylase